MAFTCRYCKQSFGDDDGHPHASPPHCYVCSSTRVFKDMQAGKPVTLALFCVNEEWCVKDWPSPHLVFAPVKVSYITIAGGTFTRRESKYIHNSRVVTFERLPYRYAIVRFRFGGSWWKGRRGDGRMVKHVTGQNHLPVSFVTFRRVKQEAFESDLKVAPPGFEPFVPPEHRHDRKRTRPGRTRPAANLGVSRADQAQAHD